MYIADAWWQGRSKKNESAAYLSSAIECGVSHRKGIIGAWGRGVVVSQPWETEIRQTRLYYNSLSRRPPYTDLVLRLLCSGCVTWLLLHTRRETLYSENLLSSQRGLVSQNVPYPKRFPAVKAFSRKSRYHFLSPPVPLGSFCLYGRRAPCHHLTPQSRYFCLTKFECLRTTVTFTKKRWAEYVVPSPTEL
jgi:hypothetical protein